MGLVKPAILILLLLMLWRPGYDCTWADLCLFSIVLKAVWSVFKYNLFILLRSLTVLMAGLAIALLIRQHQILRY